MALHVTVLDAERHQAFLKQQRMDPVVHKLLEPGDRVVACAHCRLVFLEGSWQAINGRRFGHGDDTLPDIPLDNEQFHFRSQRATPPPAPGRPSGEAAATASAAGRATGGDDRAAARVNVTTVARPAESAAATAPSAEPVEAPPADSRRAPATGETGRAVGPFRLREIPFRLREIPFTLREVAEL